MADNEKPRFSIVGGGLSGSMMAVLLGQAGHEVDVYERHGDPRGTTVGAGRSINLAVSDRAIHALERAGLADTVLSEAVPMRGRMLHDTSGRLTFQPYSKNENENINSVSRLALNVAMIEAAGRCPGVTLLFDKKCNGVDLQTGAAQFLTTTSLEKSETNGDIVIGADGAFSAVRASMQRQDRFNYQQYYLEHGYKELTIPPGPGGVHQMDRNALHIWPRRSFMMIALPNHDGSFTCTLFWPLDGPMSFDALRTDDQIRSHFEREFPDAVPLMPTLVDDYKRDPTSSLVTVRCDPWYVRDKIVLIGDAAHAVVPFYGQGINCGFEDCEALMDCIGKHSPDWERVFGRYNEMRKDNADAISNLAISNFVEMRDHVGSPRFLRKKRRERALHRLFPSFLPLYSMISFSRIPYAQAVRQAERQDRKVRMTLWAALVAGIAIVVLLVWLAL